MKRLYLFRVDIRSGWPSGRYGIGWTGLGAANIQYLAGGEAENRRIWWAIGRVAALLTDEIYLPADRIMARNVLGRQLWRTAAYAKEPWRYNMLGIAAAYDSLRTVHTEMLIVGWLLDALLPRSQEIEEENAKHIFFMLNEVPIFHLDYWMPCGISKCVSISYTCKHKQPFHFFFVKHRGKIKLNGQLS